MNHWTVVQVVGTILQQTSLSRAESIINELSLESITRNCVHTQSRVSTKVHVLHSAVIDELELNQEVLQADILAHVCCEKVIEVLFSCCANWFLRFRYYLYMLF